MILAVVAAAGAVAALGRPAPRRPPAAVRQPAATRPRPDLLAAGVVRGVCVAAGLCLAVAGAGPVGAAAGIAAALVAPRLVARAEHPRVAQVRRAVAADLPWVLEMLSAAAAAGTPPAHALAVVGSAVGGEIGCRLELVHGHLAVGAAPDDAWAEATEAGGEALTPTGEAFVAAAVDGSRLAARLQEQARDARAAAAASASAAAQRIGVRAVLPLGLCFLPAFVAVGVVPVVAAALGHLR